MSGNGVKQKERKNKIKILFIETMIKSCEIDSRNPNAAIKEAIMAML